MIREIAAKLGVQIDDGPLGSFMSKLDGAKAGILALGAAIGFSKIASFVESTAQAAFELETLSVKTGATVKEIQKLGYMLKLSGGNAEDAGKLLFELNQQLTNASGTGLYYAETLRRLGIATKDTSGKNRGLTDILPDVARAMDKASTEAQRTQIALRVFGQGGLEALRPLLKKGSAGIRELAGEFETLNLGLSRESVEANAALGKEFARLGMASKSLTGTLVAALAPVIRVIVKLAVRTQAVILEWTKKTTLLASAVTLLKTALAAYALVQSRAMLPGLLRSIQAFIKLRTAVFGASVPFVLVAAAVAFLFLVFDDLFSLMTGGESLIGRLLDKFGGVGAKAAFVKTLDAAWQNIAKTWRSLAPSFEYLLSLFADMGTKIGPAVSQVFVAIVKGIVAAISALGTLVSAAGKAMDKDYTGALNEITKGKDAIFGKRQSYWDPKSGQMVSADVGGIFGKTEAEYKSQMDTAYGKAPPPPVVNTPVSVKIDATNMAPTDALNAVKGGVAKGVSTAVEDSYGAVATFAPGGAK